MGEIQLMRNVIKYAGLALVVVGIIIVMKNLFSSDTEWKETNQKVNAKVYNISVSLMDKESKAYISDSKLVLKDESGKIVDEWITSNGVHLIGNLKNGKYTLTQTEANQKYFLNTESMTIQLNGKDEKVTMYNTALTEEQIKNGVSNNPNVTSSETAVESTGSNKHILPYIIGIISILFGSRCLYKAKEK